MARRKAQRQSGVSDKWYGKCLKRLPKKNCDELRAISKRRVSKAHFRGGPESHAWSADAFVQSAYEYEQRAHTDLRRGNCEGAYRDGLRSLSAAARGMAHAQESGMRTVVERARKAHEVVDSFMFVNMKACMKGRL